MTTQTHPKPFGPATLGPAEGPHTDILEPEGADDVLDALPLLDHHTSRRTIEPQLALRGYYLAFEDGDETRLLRLEREVTYIGRGAGSEIGFDEHRVSRSHAILVRHGRHFRLLDDRSSNGTFVNGRRIAATNVEDGDVILVGPVAMKFVEVY